MAALSQCLHVLALLCTGARGVSVCISSLYKDSRQFGLRPTLMASCYLNYLCKSFYLQIQAHSEALGLRLQHRNFEGTQSAHDI